MVQHEELEGRFLLTGNNALDAFSGDEHLDVVDFPSQQNNAAGEKIIHFVTKGR